MNIFYDIYLKHFERIALIYHICFIIFLIYLIYFRPKDQRISETFIRGLGLYVIFYGSILFFYGPTKINMHVTEK
jgi:hypothetical protein